MFNHELYHRRFVVELNEIIKNNYDLANIIKIHKTMNGTNAYFIETKQEKYIAKMNERMDFIHIYEKVQNTLKQMNLLQSSIIKTNQGGIMTSEGVVLYEFIDGDNYNTLSKSQSESAVKYSRIYNKALKLVPFKNEELLMKNHWDKARSIDFMVNEFPDFLSKIELEIKDKNNIYDVINLLSKNITWMEKQDKQLIHSDLGADNFIFKGVKVISIIDFTPDYNHELYSLCQFIYWNYLWHASSISKAEINNYLRMYNLDSDIDIEKDMFRLLLLKAALYRIVGPLIDIDNRNIKDYSGLKKRFYILNELIRD
jgi:Ser/Thr protein kinase RdoA (MazF antagonist)